MLQLHQDGVLNIILSISEGRFSVGAYFNFRSDDQERGVIGRFRHYDDAFVLRLVIRNPVNDFYRIRQSVIDILRNTDEHIRTRSHGVRIVPGLNALVEGAGVVMYILVVIINVNRSNGGTNYTACFCVQAGEGTAAKAEKCTYDCSEMGTETHVDTQRKIKIEFFGLAEVIGSAFVQVRITVCTGWVTQNIQEYEIVVSGIVGYKFLSFGLISGNIAAYGLLLCITAFVLIRQVNSPKGILARHGKRYIIHRHCDIRISAGDANGLYFRIVGLVHIAIYLECSALQEHFLHAGIGCIVVVVIGFKGRNVEGILPRFEYRCT